MKFVDAFSGCGGMSLGLRQAGWSGSFAVECETFSFETLRDNFLYAGKGWDFDWPEWLEDTPMTVRDLLSSKERELSKFRKQNIIDLSTAE